jgi:hypothetical protein
MINSNTLIYSFYFENKNSNVKVKEKIIENENFVIRDWVLMVYTLDSNGEMKIFQNYLDSDYFGAIYTKNSPAGDYSLNFKTYNYAFLGKNPRNEYSRFNGEIFDFRIYKFAFNV